MLEKLTERDRRFVIACVLSMVAFGAVGVSLFYRAFPEAAIEIAVDRREARRLAEDFLVATAGAPAEGLRGRGGAAWRFASRFATDEDAKVYLERTLGLARANRLYGREARVWSWDLRWFRSGMREEWKASCTPLGDVLAFEHVLPESAAGARLAREEAVATARSFLAGISRVPAGLDLVEVTSRTLPRRTDWTIVLERGGFRMAEATVRYRVVVSGGAVGGFREFVKVPEDWQRAYRKLRSANEATGQVDGLFLVLTFLAMLGVLVRKTVRRDVPWRVVGGFAGTCFALAFLAQANSLPLTLYDYETASPFSAFLVRQWVLVTMSALAQALFVGIIVAAAEPVFRERFPGQVSVSGVFSGRGLRTKACFRGVLLGYAMTAFFVAYQVVFYIVAERFGAWAPADVPYTDLLSTAFPWATVLLIGFLPAVSEEFMSRVFSISFLDRYLRSRALILVIPAAIWGFGHAAYPNQPFFIRGLEVGLAGVLVGVIFLRHGIVPILVWHFTVDAVYTALLMLRSGNAYYVVSAAVAAGILLVPLALATVSYRRRGGFEPAAGLTNEDQGVAPAPAGPAAAPVEAPIVRPVRAARRNVAAILAGVGLLTLLVPARRAGDETADALGRAKALALARGFLESRGERPDRFRHVLYTGSGFAEDGAAERLRPDETGRMAGFSRTAAFYVLDRGGTGEFARLATGPLTLGLWVARFFRPGEKGEWKVALDSNTGRVVQFANPAEETAPASGSPGPGEARERLAAAAERLGYAAADYSVVDVGVQTRPRRVDTRVTLESRVGAVGEARPRLTGVFHGERLAAMWPSLRLPEAFLREREARGAAYWIGVVARAVAGGAFIGAALFLAIGIVRSRAFAWRNLGVPMAWWLVLAAAAAVNAWPSLWRAYTTEIPFGTFQATLVVGTALRVLFLGVAGLVVLVFVQGACPAWRVAIRRSGGWGDALVRSGIAAAGFAALHQVERILASRFPAAFEVQGFLPASLDTWAPGYQAFISGAMRFLWVVAAAAAGSLALRDPRFSGSRPRWIAAVLGLVLLAPLEARSVGEAAGPFAIALARAAWAVAAAWILLREHVAAWVLCGAFVASAPQAFALLVQPARPDQVQGLLALGLTVLAAGLLTARRGRAAWPAGPPVG